MKNYCERMKKDIQNISHWDKYVETAEIAYLALENEAAERRYPYKNFIRRVSRYTPNLRQEMEEEYWKGAERAIRDAYEIIITELDVLGGVDKKHFFTCKILCYLTQSSRKLKVANID